MEASKSPSHSHSLIGGSEKLAALATQLRLYKAPPTRAFDDEDNDEDSEGKFVSQVGVVESATPVIVMPDRFRAKRAAVLICLFEDGDGIGDLRVILTKRSSQLSSHSGQSVILFSLWILKLLMQSCLIYH